MKKVFFIHFTSFFRLLLLCLLLGCSKDDSIDDKFEGTMQAKINGELVVFNSVNADGPIDNHNFCLKYINHVHGGLYLEEDSVAHTISISVPTFYGVGTYNANGLYLRKNLTFSPHNNTAGYYQNYPGTELHQEGEVTITSMANGECIGTFYFTGINLNGQAERLGFSDTMVITEGKFRIPTEFKSFCTNN